MSNVETIENNQTKQTNKSKGKKSSKTVKKVEDDETLLNTPILEVKEETPVLEQVTLSNEEENTDISNDEDSSSINETEDVSNPEEVSIPEEYLNNLKTAEVSLEFLSKSSLKNYVIDKEFFSILSSVSKKLNKYFHTFNQGFNDYLVKEQAVVIKKQSKSKKTNKVIDKSKRAINILQDTYPEVLKIMKLDNGVQLSKTNIIQFINTYVKKEKTTGDKNIFVEGDNRSFNIIGEIKELFDFVRTVMIDRGDMQEDEEFPKQLTYTGIFKYLKYCFPVIQK